MKQLLQFTLALCLIAAIIVIACKKSSSNNTVPTTSLNQLFAGLNSIPENFTVTAGRDTIIYGTSDSTLLHFYTNSFKDANGNVITSGTIYVQLTEMYKAGEMIRNRATTVANGHILQSCGQINIVQRKVMDEWFLLTNMVSGLSSQDLLPSKWNCIMEVTLMQIL